MASLILEIFISLVITVIGFVIILKIYFSGKFGKKIWDLYGEVAQECPLSRQEGRLGNYGLPDLFGEVKGRRVYVHPSKKRRGKGERPAKTIIAVENTLDISQDLIVSNPETSDISGELPRLEITALERFDYRVNTPEGDGEKAYEIFTDEVAKELNRMIVKNGESFRALILEPGAAMFSTYGMDMDKERMMDNLHRLIDLVDLMEETGPVLEEGMISERFETISKKNSLLKIEMSILVILLGTAVYLIYDSILSRSYLFSNVGVILLLITSVRLYTNGWIRGWYRR